MTTTVMNPKVDAFLKQAQRWREEFEALRRILLDCRLTEELKWGVPCYTLERSNIVLMHGFNDYCAVLFFKGALLPDPAGVLVQQTKNVQAGRQIRFVNAGEIIALEAVLKAYVKEAIEVEKAGLKVNFKPAAEFETPEEFQAKLDETAGLRTAFDALTPGRRRAYLLHFSAPRQSKTRAARVEKSIEKILDGKGLDD